MTKQEFMYRLAQQLVSLPPEERVCALKFYDEYFADAGEENWEAVLRELGSPEEVARTIKEDFAQRNPGYQPDAGSASQYNYRPGPQYQPGQGRQAYTTYPTYTANPAYRPTGPAGYGGVPPQETRKRMSGGSIALIIVLLILGSPVWLPLLLVVLALAAGLGIAVVAVVVALATAAVAVTCGLVVLGVGCAWSSVTAMALPLGMRLLGIGGGLVFTGIGMLICLAGLWLALRVVPGLFRWLVDLFRRLFHKKGGAR